jgi:multiple sugar transport system permease protein
VETDTAQRRAEVAQAEAVVRSRGRRRTHVLRLTRKRREALWALFFLPPFIIGLVFFIVGPGVAAVAISFTDWDLLSSPRWVGLANYRELIHDPVFVDSLLNTLYYTAVTVPLSIVLGLGLAVLMNRKIRGSYVFRAVYFLPVTVSIVAVSLLWSWMFQPSYGFLNYVLAELHLPTVDWLVNPATALPSIMIVGVWRTLGFNILVFLAGLQSVPAEMHEAAQVDGAGEWYRFRRVTLPMLSPTLFFAIVMGLIASFQVFEQTYIMTQGGPGNSTMTLIYYIFLSGFTNLRMGYASAISVVFLLIILAITVVQVRLQSKWVHYE